MSGCSLKSVIAAASLLHWAEQAHLSARSSEEIQDAFYGWFNALSAVRRNGDGKALFLQIEAEQVGNILVIFDD